MEYTVAICPSYFTVVSKKVELLKQVNEMSAIKNDLALEVNTAHLIKTLVAN